MNSYDVEVQWLITEVCNFDCEYCWLHDTPKNRRFLGDNNTRKIVDGFNNQGVTWLIHMTGGEPFFYPNFVELCRELTHKHTISINSNLTHKNVAQFIKTINPKKVDFIHSSLHITERSRINRIEDFVEKYRMLKDAGFNVFVSYLMYPSFFNRFESDYQYFKSQGIILHPKVFWGKYSGIFDSKSFLKMGFFNRLRKHFQRDYPDSYASQQKRFFKDFVDRSVADEIQIYGSSADSKESTVDLALDKNWVNRLLSFTGRRCSAGRRVVRMEKDGEVYRCIDETQYHLGNMFSGRLKFLEEDLICRARICSCPYVGMRYVLPTEKILRRRKHDSGTNQGDPDFWAESRRW